MYTEIQENYLYIQDLRIRTESLKVSHTLREKMYPESRL